ncbi:MAG: CPBP family intramembrane glutamic endopeptidase [Acutalibacteraceae bacterium]|nr:CPBP family intramembrane glutamic endopeptidase [Acutalibacteraceae bacterium]
MFYNEYSVNIKKSIFKHSLYIGIALLISVGIQLIFSFVSMSVLAFNGYAIDEILQAFTDTWSGYLLNTITIVFICTVPFLILRPLNNRPVYEICSFNSPKKSLTFPCVVFAFGGAMFANIFTSFFVTFLENFFGFEATQGSIGDNSFNSPIEFVYTIVCAALVPALFEEFAFRGMIMGSLRKFGDMPAILVSALIFAFYHGNFIQIPFAFLVGIFLGLIVVITDSIWPAVIAHCVNNIFAVIAISISNDYPMFISKLFLLIIFCGIIALVVLVKKKAFSNIERKTTVVSGQSKFLRMLSSPTIVIYFIIMIVMALMNKA